MDPLVLLSPPVHRRQDRAKFEPQRPERVFHFRRILRIHLAVDNTCRFQLAKLLGQRAMRDTRQFAMEFGKPRRTFKKVVQDHSSPATWRRRNRGYPRPMQVPRFQRSRDMGAEALGLTPQAMTLSPLRGSSFTLLEFRTARVSVVKSHLPGTNGTQRDSVVAQHVHVTLTFTGFGRACRKTFPHPPSKGDSCGQSTTFFILRSWCERGHPSKLFALLSQRICLAHLPRSGDCVKCGSLLTLYKRKLASVNGGDLRIASCQPETASKLAPRKRQRAAAVHTGRVASVGGYSPFLVLTPSEVRSREQSLPRV